MSFDKNLAKKIQEEAQIALEKVAKKYGVTIKSNGGTLGENDFSMKMKVELVNVAKKYSPWVFTSLNLPEDITGKTFINRGEKFTITELNTRSPKYPVIAENESGKGYKFTVTAVKTLMK